MPWAIAIPIAIAVAKAAAVGAAIGVAGTAITKAATGGFSHGSVLSQLKDFAVSAGKGAGVGAVTAGVGEGIGAVGNAVSEAGSAAGQAATSIGQAVGPALNVAGKAAQGAAGAATGYGIGRAAGERGGNPAIDIATGAISSGLVGPIADKLSGAVSGQLGSEASKAGAASATSAGQATSNTGQGIEEAIGHGSGQQISDILKQARLSAPYGITKMFGEAPTRSLIQGVAQAGVGAALNKQNRLQGALAGLAGGVAEAGYNRAFTGSVAPSGPGKPLGGDIQGPPRPSFTSGDITKAQFLEAGQNVARQAGSAFVGGALTVKTPVQTAQLISTEWNRPGRYGFRRETPQYYPTRIL